jgi:hypothetical protein
MKVNRADGDVSRQQAMESRLVQIWAGGFADQRRVADVFGPYEDWLLPMGGDLLLLHPVVQEWWVLDQLHDAWVSTGFGPGEVSFAVEDRRLRASPVDPPSQPGDRDASDEPDPPGASSERARARGLPERPGQRQNEQATACAQCGARVAFANKFCPRCGAPLTG